MKYSPLHLAGVGGVDAVDVSPDGDGARLEQSPQDGGTVVAAIALQGGHVTLQCTSPSC